MRVPVDLYVVFGRRYSIAELEIIVLKMGYLRLLMVGMAE